MSAIYTVRCDVRDCIEVFNPCDESAKSRYSLESCRATSRMRGWATVMRGDGTVFDLCPSHKDEKPWKAKP